MNRFIDPQGKKSGKREAGKEPTGTKWKRGSGRAINGRAGGKAALDSQAWSGKQPGVCVCLGLKSWGQQVCEISMMTGGSVVDVLV